MMSYQRFRNNGDNASDEVCTDGYDLDIEKGESSMFGDETGLLSGRQSSVLASLTDGYLDLDFVDEEINDYTKDLDEKYLSMPEEIDDFGFDLASPQIPEPNLTFTTDVEVVAEHRLRSREGLEDDVDSKWLKQKKKELTRTAVDESFAGDMDKHDLISCLEFMATWMTKSEDELMESGIRASLLEENFHILVDVWESFG
ncbi:MAG: hypothetical protein GY854_04495 [Deltaproteobacteria bacterium]|nr:hypothetical protein [Deltaproteobacteria bacterium]